MKTKSGLFVLKLIFFYPMFGPEVIGGIDNIHEYDEQPLPILKSEVIHAIKSQKMASHQELTMYQASY